MFDGCSEIGVSGPFIAGLRFVRGESIPRLTLRAVFLMPSRFQKAHAFTVKRHKHIHTLIQIRKKPSSLLRRTFPEQLLLLSFFPTSGAAVMK